MIVAMPLARMASMILDEATEGLAPLIAGGFGESTSGIAEKRPADGQHLLLTARELLSAVTWAVTQAARMRSIVQPVFLSGEERAAISRFSFTDKLGKMPRPSGT